MQFWREFSSGGAVLLGCISILIFAGYVFNLIGHYGAINASHRASSGVAQLETNLKQCETSTNGLRQHLEVCKVGSSLYKISLFLENLENISVLMRNYVPQSEENRLSQLSQSQKKRMDGLEEHLKISKIRPSYTPDR